MSEKTITDAFIEQQDERKQQSIERRAYEQRRVTDTISDPQSRMLLEFFRFEHLPPHLQEISKPCGELADTMAKKLEGPELEAGLRKLLEAKDCFVRALVAKR